MSSALIVVDVQKDFLPGGALGVTDGDAVIDPLIVFGQSDLVEHVVFTQDFHPPNHIGHRTAYEKGNAFAAYEDGNWPVHCIAGTAGAEIAPELLAAFPEAPVFQKGFNPEFEAYSGFDGILQGNEPGTAIGLAQWLDRNGVRDVFVGGLALDYCVRATAFGAFEYTFETTVLLDATRPVSYLGGVETAAQMGRYSGNGLSTAAVTDLG